MGRWRSTGIVIVTALATLAFAGLASAGNTATLKEVSGTDNGNGTANYTIQLKGSKDCRKGRKVSLDAGSAPGAAPKKLGTGKTNKKGKASFEGPMPSSAQRITLKTKAKGNCMTPYAILRFDEVFETG